MGKGGEREGEEVGREGMGSGKGGERTVEGNDDGSTGETIRGGSWEWKVWCRPS